MMLFLSLIVSVLVLAVVYSALRRWILHPLARLRRTLTATGLTPTDSKLSTIELATAHWQKLTTRIQKTERDLARLQSILEKTHDGIIFVDSNLRIIWVNEAAAKIFGQAGTGLEGKRLTELARDKQVYDGFRDALEQQKPFEGRLERIEGIERRFYHLRIAPIGEGKAAGVFLDVTRLERLERVRQEFLANVSHELRTPLTAILAYVETLLEGAIDDPENNVRFLEIVQKHGQRLTNLVNDISDLSAIECGNVRLDPMRLNVRQVVEEVIVTLHPRVEQCEVHLFNDVPSDLVLTADRGRFEQILLNLIDNAVKFNHRGGEVRVIAERRNGSVSISVKDTGIGIPASDLPRIFERFYRVDKGRSMELGGTGLGLAIVKHLVRIQGGKITVKSKPGEGTCFNIVWPDGAASEPVRELV
ncbi:MAG: PAS domain-containing protein [Acidobacteria bacterium]|nr:PAS domain-containing protein [Acidobacteriota bacterium]